MTTGTGIDWQQSITLANNSEDVAKELLTMLLNELPHALNTILTAKQNNDREILLHHVHKLHGACCYCGVPALRNTLNQLETLLKSDSGSEQIAPLIETLEQSIKIIEKDYKQLIT